MKKYATIVQMKEEFQICRNTIVRYATEAGAVVKIGKSIRIDTEKFVAYLEKVNNMNETE